MRGAKFAAPISAGLLFTTNGYEECQLIPVACRFVPTDQWLVTHVDSSWKIRDVKQWFLRKCNANIDAAAPKFRPTSPVTFSAVSNTRRRNGFGPDDDDDFSDDIPDSSSLSGSGSLTATSPSEAESDGSDDDVFAYKPPPVDDKATPMKTKKVDIKGKGKARLVDEDEDSDFTPETYVYRPSVPNPAHLHGHPSTSPPARPHSPPFVRSKSPSLPPIIPPTKPPSAQASSSPSDIRAVINGASSSFSLYSFSNGHLLEDDNKLSYYGLRPYELVEIHRAGCFARLDRGHVERYVCPYWDGLVDVLVNPIFNRDLDLNCDRNKKNDVDDDGWEHIHIGSGPAFGVTGPLAGSSIAMGAGKIVGAGMALGLGLGLAAGVEREREREREKDWEKDKAREGGARLQREGSLYYASVEWRQRWVVVRNGTLQIRRSLDDFPIAEYQLADLLALVGADHVATTSSSREPDSSVRTAESNSLRINTQFTPLGGTSTPPASSRPRTICAKFRVHNTHDRRGSQDFAKNDILEKDGPTLPLPGSGGGDAKGKTKEPVLNPEEKGTWLIMDMPDDLSFSNILRILHRALPNPFKSTFLAAAKGLPLTPMPSPVSRAASPNPGSPNSSPKLVRQLSPKPNPGIAITSSDALSIGGTTLASSPIFSPPTSPTVKRRSRSNTTPTPSSTPHYNPSLPTPFGFFGVAYPEWRLHVVRQAQQAGLGAETSALAHMVWGRKFPFGPPVPTLFPYLELDAVDLETETTVVPPGLPHIWADLEDEDRESENEWEGWVRDVEHRARHPPSKSSLRPETQSSSHQSSPSASRRPSKLTLDPRRPPSAYGYSVPPSPYDSRASSSLGYNYGGHSTASGQSSAGPASPTSGSGWRRRKGKGAISFIPGRITNGSSVTTTVITVGSGPTSKSPKSPKIPRKLHRDGVGAKTKDDNGGVGPIRRARSSTVSGPSPSKVKRDRLTKESDLQNLSLPSGIASASSSSTTTSTKLRKEKDSGQQNRYGAFLKVTGPPKGSFLRHANSSSVLRTSESIQSTEKDTKTPAAFGRLMRGVSIRRSAVSSSKSKADLVAASTPTSPIEGSASAGLEMALHSLKK